MLSGLYAEQGQLCRGVVVALTRQVCNVHAEFEVAVLATSVLRGEIVVVGGFHPCSQRPPRHTPHRRPHRSGSCPHNRGNPVLGMCTNRRRWPRRHSCTPSHLCSLHHHSNPISKSPRRRRRPWPRQSTLSFHRADLNGARNQGHWAQIVVIGFTLVVVSCDAAQRIAVALVDVDVRVDGGPG